MLTLKLYNIPSVVYKKKKRKITAEVNFGGSYLMAYYPLPQLSQLILYYYGVRIGNINLSDISISSMRPINIFCKNKEKGS